MNWMRALWYLWVGSSVSSWPLGAFCFAIHCISEWIRFLIAYGKTCQKWKQERLEPKTQNLCTHVHVCAQTYHHEQNMLSSLNVACLVWFRLLFFEHCRCKAGDTVWNAKSKMTGAEIFNSGTKPGHHWQAMAVGKLQRLVCILELLQKRLVAHYHALQQMDPDSKINLMKRVIWCLNVHIRVRMSWNVHMIENNIATLCVVVHICACFYLVIRKEVGKKPGFVIFKLKSKCCNSFSARCCIDHGSILFHDSRSLFSRSHLSLWVQVPSWIKTITPGKLKGLSKPNLSVDVVICTVIHIVLGNITDLAVSLHICVRMCT